MGIMEDYIIIFLKQLMILFGCLFHAGYAQGPLSPIVRLVNGASSSEGRVEIFINGEWGTVCDDYWDNSDAKVVCNMLNISGQVLAVGGAYFGRGSGLIHINEVQCTGSEVSILACKNSGLGNYCHHSEDAGVICEINVSKCGSQAWTYFYEVDLCFSIIHQRSVSWTKARRTCQDVGGDLVSLSTLEKQYAAERFLGENDLKYEVVWIGLRYTGGHVHRNGTYEERRADWQWVDGSGPNIGYTSKWYSLSPNMSDEYGAIHGYHWYGTQIDRRSNHSFCEKGPSPPTLRSSTTRISSPVSSSTTDLTSTTVPLRTRTTSTSTLSTTTTTEQSTTVSSIVTTQATRASANQTSKPDSDISASKCGGNQWQYSEEAKRCYSLQNSSNPVSWDEAEKRCRRIDAYLASPSNAVQHAAVDNLTRQADLSDTDVWIGLWHDSGASGLEQHQLRQGWKWLDGSTYSFEAWSQEEPEEGERYARLKQGKWYGTGGSYSLFLCQKEPGKSTEMDFQLALVALLAIPVIIAVIIIAVCRKRKPTNKDERKIDETEWYCEIELDLSDKPSDSSEAHVYCNETNLSERPALKQSGKKGVPVLPKHIQTQNQTGAISYEDTSSDICTYTQLPYKPK